jgi:uncharacterized protein (TIGR03663 family)|tara:strand:+ start:23257 stop:25221 length:1965 start_codon:yes stop_codon:yes gene_type:complete
MTTERFKRSISPLSIIIILAVIALIFRLLFLSERPFHHDESLDAWFSLRFLAGEYNGYDPVYHGPLRFYLTAAIFWLFGITDLTARLLAAIAGFMLIFAPLIWRKQVGVVGAIGAMTLISISPTMVYFSRFGREDSLFLLLTTIFVIFMIAFLEKPKGWHPAALLITLVLSMAVKESVLLTIFLFSIFILLYSLQESLSSIKKATTRQPSLLVSQLVLAIGLLSLTLMLAWLGEGGGKETIVKLACYGGFLLLLNLGIRIVPTLRKQHLQAISLIWSIRVVNIKQWISSLAAASIIFVALFTQLFTNFSGPNTQSAPNGALRNGITAGFRYWSNQQSTGARGDSRWHYYLSVLVAYEWVILLVALFGVWKIIRKPTLFNQAILWWATGGIIVYSWAAERMPWLIIHILLPTIIIAGIGIQHVWETVSTRKIKKRLTYVITILLLFFVTFQSVITNFDGPGDPNELLVQAGQATPEVTTWADQLYDLNRVFYAEKGRHLSVQIDNEIYWPYGWYLRDFPTSTYASIAPKNVTSLKTSPDIVFLPQWDRDLAENLSGDYTVLPYNHRWWWVPQYDAGISSLADSHTLLGNWAQWIWRRTPWRNIEGKPAQCPAALSGNVYIKDSVLELAKQTDVWNEPHLNKSRSLRDSFCQFPKN